MQSKCQQPSSEQSEFEVNPKKSEKIVDLVNAEGPLLSLYKRENGGHYLEAQLKDGSAKIYFDTQKDLLEPYFRGELKTRELLQRSRSSSITIKPRAEKKNLVSKDSFNKEVQCGEYFFTELPQGMALEEPERFLKEMI
ncbi:hypothetical protein [Rufibacter roseolus]|uniref:hypothetical protein n=1 Tax=Rufibacter roseolus TaxID=2817375 RepID=UPI001B303228|nr:hypothetical protein [Rufibacter roseolus]